MGYFFRLLQLLSTCVALSLVASENTWIADVSNWSMFTWCFCFVVTLLSLIVELCRLQENFSRSWNNFLITYTCFSALVCLSASIMYPIIHLQMLSYGTQWNHAIAATAFSCIASVAYAMETVWTCVNTSESCSFISLLKKLEITVACGILAFISNTFLYMHHLALVWCVAVYSICFILGVISLLQHRCDCDESLPSSRFVFGQTCSPSSSMPLLLSSGLSISSTSSLAGIPSGLEMQAAMLGIACASGTNNWLWPP